MIKFIYIACVLIGALYIYGLLSKFFFGGNTSSNIKKNKSGKRIEFKDADFEEID